jgi:hypothetical protein
VDTKGDVEYQMEVSEWKEFLRQYTQRSFGKKR